MIADIAAAAKANDLFKGTLRRLYIKAELRVRDCQLIFRKNRGISSNHVFLTQCPDGDVPRRMARRGSNLTTAAPIKSVSVMEQNIRKNRTEISVSFAELLAKGLLVIRKVALQFFALPEPEIFSPAGNIRRLYFRGKNLNGRILRFQFRGRAHMVIILMGQQQLCEGARLNAVDTELFFYHKKRARITAVNKNNIALSKEDSRKNMLLNIAKYISQIEYLTAPIHAASFSPKISL